MCFHDSKRMTFWFFEQVTRFARCSVSIAEKQCSHLRGYPKTPCLVKTANKISLVRAFLLYLLALYSSSNHNRQSIPALLPKTFMTFAKRGQELRRICPPLASAAF